MVLLTGSDNSRKVYNNYNNLIKILLFNKSKNFIIINNRII